MTLAALIRELLNWRSLLDIALIAALLFFLYRTLIRLGTWKILAGIVIAVLVFIGAQTLELKGTEWIFGNLSHVAVIALIVIFQPELRKLFERAATIRGVRPPDVGEKLAAEIAEALFRIAHQRQGAIAVIPGREPLQEWLAGGHVLNAAPSIPLMLSIFDPNSPGHDGALVIRDGRFQRFGVRLPASQSDKLPAEFGTRHNAGMGLSERADALVIVVSEERGMVSTFLRGAQRQVANPDRLAEAICSHWKDSATAGLQWADRENRWLIAPQLAASLALAMVFWGALIVVQGEALEKVVTVPVEFTAPPPNLMLMGDKQKAMRLHLSGLRSDLEAMGPSQLNVKVDLSRAVPGKQAFVINRDNLRLPKDVRLLDVSPASLELSLVEIVQREVAVSPQLVGKLPAGMALQEIAVSPSRVVVHLPAEMGKDKAVELRTTPIYLDGIQESTRLFCKIIASPSIHPVDRRWPDVEVGITLKRIPK
jgi:diadenylate cyclase